MELKDADYYKAYKKWQRLSGVFDCFVHTTSFATLKEYPGFTLHVISSEQDGRSVRIMEFVKEQMGPQTLFFIDLPLLEALKHSLYLNQELQIMPVLTARHMNHPYGLVGGQDIISALIIDNAYKEAANPNGYAFLLDSERYSDYADDIFKMKFNNQYEISEYDVPTIEMLLEYNYSKIVFIYDNQLKEDIDEYKNYLITENFNVVCFNVSSSEETAANG